ncbi:unnamed protein product [Arabidopsis thaliana]|uniref:Uncharacterized protein n=2 Tax=Arabidopsis TaxID=3701 RepID=Q9LJ38_ARATH|nr:Ferredoxin-NADP reductase (FNR) nucleotide-binding domain [Arabidopsis suecica]BAB01220.1 unnamed protein product [Arabidopsis thaliana]
MSKKVWDLLCDGAVVYVAGSSTEMPSDVMSALGEIVSEETGGSKEVASRRLKALEKAQRYNVEACLVYEDAKSIAPEVLGDLRV